MNSDLILQNVENLVEDIPWSVEPTYKPTWSNSINVFTQ